MFVGKDWKESGRLQILVTIIELAQMIQKTKKKKGNSVRTGDATAEILTTDIGV
jgi:hypothetical protein